MPSAVFVLCQIKSKGLDGGFTALQFFERGIWQVFFRISGREIVFFLGFWAKVFFGSLGGVKICFYLMAYGSFRLLDLLTLDFGYGVGRIEMVDFARLQDPEQYINRS
ncbi:hypothetical protein RhiirA5_502801 [Rhizophagus irregularis]|uniref:Uncharacterized protein n=1 Tax=Rhizophagus irregularis TaxID=588596 RepID=A0A2N0PC37_9GLOM|nr:hypothetical protein RhiirA5_502801 [Rhizophagus irregularis]